MKNKTYGYIALVIGLIVFNVIALVIPVDHTSAFWTVFAFTNAAFVAQLVIWKRAFKKANGLKSKFLGIPIAYVGILYLICQLICFAAVVASHSATWVAIVSSITILGISCLLMTAGAISRNTVQALENKVNDETAFMRELRLKIDCMIAEEKDPEIRTKLQDVADVAKYSDSRSSQYSMHEENSIEKQLEVFTNNHSVQPLELIVDLLNKRNLKIQSVR